MIKLINITNLVNLTTFYFFPRTPYETPNPYKQTPKSCKPKKSLY